MKTPNWLPWNKRRQRACAVLRRLGKRRENQLGSELLSEVVSEIESGEIESALKLLDKFEIVATDLSPSDVGIVQHARTGLGVSYGEKATMLVASSALIACWKMLGPLTWQWLITLIQISFCFAPAPKHPGTRSDFGDKR